ncbi:FxSxx-COOH system tetratricopeptide repeat protein [Streptomyces tagetis]|uniref:Tetratricopeptide repeat protein n=1 Tax=Streptomyces tagetis TaxID=2820809 RepID=A0A940X929_9ACTN|nr:FxSxx-COOH system tetratricopeptide repeat protein [Streptomyces sp. RG38]MBQ0825603.1 tetratricopeptide repeat protein [Streptomyces sp. RG38]
MALGKGHSLPRTTLGEVLRGRRFPSKAFLLTFVELCGAEPDEIRVWESTWNRLAVRYKVGEPAQRPDGTGRMVPYDGRRAAELEQQVTELRERLRQQGLAVERAARAWTSVGDALRGEGHWSSAGVVYGAVADLQRALSARHAPAFFRARCGVIEVLAARGRYEEAEAAARRLAEDCATSLGADHPDTVTAQQMLTLVRNPSPALAGATVTESAGAEAAGAAVTGATGPGGAAAPVVVVRSAAVPGPRGPRPARERVAGGLPTIWNLEPRNPEFTGRDTILGRLRERFGQGGASVVQALRGPGGVGKTQIAVEYAHRHADEYDLVWWVASEDSSLVGEQIAALAVQLELVERGTDTVTAAAVTKAFLRGRDRWLLIFDNAEERAGVSEWLPGGPGHVLITSRAGGWERIAAITPVDVMAAAESVALLQTHCPDLRREEAESLAGELDFLPLALCQAGGFLSETATGVGDYLALLQAHPAALLSEGDAGDYPRSLAAVIGLSLDQLAQADPVGLATVRVCALLAPESVPVRWLMSVEDIAAGDDEPIAALAEVAADEMRLRRAIGTAVRFGLAKSNRDGVRLHRLVQGVVRDLLPEPARARVRRHARALLVANAPGDPEDPATWTAWAPMVPHVLAVEPTTPTDLHLRILACDTSWYLIERGDADAGARLTRALRASWLRHLGADDVHVLWATRCLARALREQGHYEEARRLYDDALPRYHRVLGGGHPDTLRLAHGSAINLRLLGQYAAARALQAETLRSYRNVLGEDHPHTLHSANHLAADLSALGHYDEARRLHEDTLVRYRRVLGDDHPDTLRSANHLAADLVALGEYAKARVLDEDTLARCRRVFGEDHPHTLRAATSYTTILRKLGMLQQALALQEETLTRSRRVLGADHPQSLRTARALCETLHHLHLLDRARELQEDTVRRCRRVLGADHPETRGAEDQLRKIGEQR